MSWLPQYLLSGGRVVRSAAALPPLFAAEYSRCCDPAGHRFLGPTRLDLSMGDKVLGISGGWVKIIGSFWQCQIGTRSQH